MDFYGARLKVVALQKGYNSLRGSFVVGLDLSELHRFQDGIYYTETYGKANPKIKKSAFWR